MHLMLAVVMNLMVIAPSPPAEATHRGDFDYLLGDWEFTAVSQQYGKFRGYWSAVRLGDGGQILDEYRVVGDNGETFYVTRTLRAYNAVSDQWELVSTDQGSGLQNLGTGRRDGAEMRIEQKFGFGTPRPSIWRIRYYDIRPDRFSWTADRSADGGKTWTTNFQQIEARRIGPSRSLDPLAAPRVAPATIWGGEHVEMQVTKGGAQLEFDCATGTITEALTTDPQGHFSVKGTLTPEHGGPIRQGETAQVMEATYSGVIGNDTMTLQLRVGDKELTQYTLKRSQRGKLLKCK